MFNRRRQSSSTASLNSGSRSSQSTRPPTYTSNQTLAPTYASNPTMAPTYTSQVTGQNSVTSTHQDTLTDSFSHLSTTDASSLAELPAATTSGPRHLYYRIYTEDGAIHSLKPIDGSDGYLGRILTTSVPPPRTGLSLKRCLCKFEGIDDGSKSLLYVSSSSQSPMDDKQKVSLSQNVGPGSSPHEPMAIVVQPRQSADEPNAEMASSSPDIQDSTHEQIYVYYRVYKDDIDVPSQCSADEANPSVGRMNANRIAPPHTAASLKRCLCKLEGHTNVQASTLFLNVDSESPMPEEHISLLGESRPGATMQDPMALVLSDSVAETQLTEPTESTFLNLNPTFTKTIRAIYPWDHGGGTTGWLNHALGEKFRTDGIVRRETNPYDSYTYNVYRAQNAAGKIGFVFAGMVEFC